MSKISNDFVDLGKELGKKELEKENFKKLVKDSNIYLTEKFSDIYDQIELDQNFKSLKNTLADHNNFTNNREKILVGICKIKQKNINNLKKEINIITSHSNDVQEQNDEYITQLDEKDVNIKKFQSRVIKLREKCVEKNNYISFLQKYIMIFNLFYILMSEFSNIKFFSKFFIELWNEGFYSYYFWIVTFIAICLYALDLKYKPKSKKNLKKD